MDRISALSHLLHRRLLPLIVGSYALAATFPAAGLWIKDAAIVDFGSGAGRVTMTIPKLLLALLLFNAGMRTRLSRVGQIARRPGVVLAGLAANLAVPLLFLILMVPALGAWHNPDEAAVVLVGLALVTAMPIAGSSTGWAQAADGDMALSLALVLGSTLLSPLTTPASLHALGLLAPGRYGDMLHGLAGRDTGTFLAAWVLLPSLLGIAARSVLSDPAAQAVERRLKVVAPLTLLVLCYSNASACLPQTIQNPDWDFLAIVLTFVLALCTLTFAAGLALAHLLRVDPTQRAALMFGLGMNNNGTGLVLASLALGSQPMMLLPIIIYNLTQHLVAGAVNALLRRAQPA
jgi:BASS family bile acid:Na+ symporter